MSVIVGISADSDFLLQNAGYRILMEIAFARTDRPEDRLALEAGGWAHFLDLPRLEAAQARRLAWLLDEAAGVRIEDWRAEGTPTSLSGAEYYGSFQALLRRKYGRPPEVGSEREHAAVEA